MKFTALVFALFCFSENLSAQKITPSDKPNKTQQLLINRGYGMFIHFGGQHVYRSGMVGRKNSGGEVQSNKTGLRPMGAGSPRCPVSLRFANHQPPRR